MRMLRGIHTGCPGPALSICLLVRVRFRTVHPRIFRSLSIASSTCTASSPSVAQLNHKLRASLFEHDFRSHPSRCWKLCGLPRVRSAGPNSNRRGQLRNVNKLNRAFEAIWGLYASFSCWTKAVSVYLECYWLFV